MLVTNQMIKDAMSGLENVYVTDGELVREIPGARHLRSGKISKDANYRLAGTEVHALGYDELGNLVYMECAGHIRQEIRKAGK